MSWSPADRDPGERGSVGALLAATREREGEDLGQVAAVLRIRRTHLEAIEQGRYEDLPGATYAAGFVRSYADYLGLDAEEVVRRFKQEGMAPGPSRNDFPVPSSESRLPGPGLILAGLLVAGLGYGAWYLATAESDLATMVGELPARFSDLVGGDETAPAPPATRTPEAESGPETGPEIGADPDEDAPPPEPEPLAGATPGATAGTATDGVADAVPNGAPTSEAPAPPASATDGAAPVASADPAPSTGSADSGAQTLPAPRPIPLADPPQPPAATAEAAPASTPGADSGESGDETPDTPPPPAEAAEPRPATAASSLPVPEPATDAAGDSPAPAEPPAAPAEPAPQANTDAAPADTAPAAAATQSTTRPTAQPATQPTTRPATLPAVPADPAAPDSPLAQGGDGRVVIHARQGVWFQIKAGDELVTSRLLRQGDSYTVPARDNLILITGNAGGMEIEVDGQPVPPIGAQGEVVRGVSLDPADLKRR